MTFFGILIGAFGLAAFVWGGYIIFRDILFPLYEETHLRKKYERDLFDKVRWIAIKSFEYRDDDLCEYIISEQHELDIATDFCIDFSNVREKDFMCKILNIQKQQVIESFFGGSLKKDKAFYTMNCLEYYMVLLLQFLEKNETIEKLDDITLFEFAYKDNLYKTFKFTDYGVIYLKLKYIVALFCVNNEKIKPLLTDSTNRINNIKKQIESRELKLWSR